MKYKSEMLAVIHEDAVEMYKVGGITEARMREYDEMCLEPEALPDNAENINIEHAELVTA